MKKTALDAYQVNYHGELLAGVDEVGRGPLAGDVVTAAVILDKNNPIEGLRDSKKISEKKRLALFDEIKMKALSYSIARCNVTEIDELNILQASLLAMRRAVEGLAIQPEYVAVDGNKIPRWNYQAEAVVKGDDRVQEIAAASILAKVTRDQELVDLHTLFPQYGFDRHKGYPTKVHMAAIEEYGITEHHRKSFGPVKKAIEKVGLSL